MIKHIVCLAIALACASSAIVADDTAQDAANSGGALQRTLNKVVSTADKGTQRIQNAVESGSQRVQNAIGTGAKTLQSVASKSNERVHKMADGLQARADSYVAAQQAKLNEPRRGVVSSTIRGAGRLARNFTLEGARFVGTIGSGAVNLAKNTVAATAVAAVGSVDRLLRRNRKQVTNDSTATSTDGQKPNELVNNSASATDAQPDATAPSAETTAPATEATAPVTETTAPAAETTATSA